MNENLFRFRFGDAIVVAAVLIVALAAFWGVNSGGEGLTAVIICDGEASYYSLHYDRTIELDGLTVVISDGCVYVSESVCDDRVCVNTGKISKSGQFIACLPLKTFVKVISEGDEGYADFISG